ncbi:GIY-YIG nuclease family protein [Laceyella putida]|uniref:GIY-YIG nuclease family protein n=1 Tax=Laceyella putida TaxID=110101 RepID=A0ABW2RN06_9BACL
MDKQKRKQIAKNYKQTHRPMGVYQIANQANGKILIGGSMNLDSIFNREKFVLSLGRHSNRALQADWNHYGEEAFTFDILEQIKPQEEIILHFDELNKYRDELKKLEQKWLDRLQPYHDRGYNLPKKSRNAGQP